MYGYIRIYMFVQRMCRHGILNTTYAYELLHSALKDNYTAIHWTMKNAYNLQIYHNNHRPIIVPLRCQWQRLSPVRLLPRCSHRHLVPPCWLQLTHQAAFWAPPPLHQWPPWAAGGTEAPLWLASIHIREKGWFSDSSVWKTGLARQTCPSHAGIREPNLSHDCASGEALASSIHKSCVWSRVLLVIGMVLCIPHCKDSLCTHEWRIHTQLPFINFIHVITYNLLFAMFVLLYWRCPMVLWTVEQQGHSS